MLVWAHSPKVAHLNTLLKILFFIHWMFIFSTSFTFLWLWNCVDLVGRLKHFCMQYIPMLRLWSDVRVNTAKVRFWQVQGRFSCLCSASHTARDSSHWNYSVNSIFCNWANGRLELKILWASSSTNRMPAHTIPSFPATYPLFQILQNRAENHPTT